MVACNAGVWMCFVKALQQSPSSLPPTIISAAINYISSVCCITDYFVTTKGMAGSHPLCWRYCFSITATLCEIKINLYNFS
jgi:hypothetical protein